jgi:hypothetical protein
MTSSWENDRLKCKYCGGNAIVKCGSYLGIPRYFCKLCKRKFKNDNHAFRMSVPVEYLAYVLNSYYGGAKFEDIRINLKKHFGCNPSATLVRLWINKYTALASRMMENHHTAVGATWVLNEMVLVLNKQRVRIYEVVDNRTYYLLALEFTLSNKIIVKSLIRRASEKAGIIPELILVHMPPSRFKKMMGGAGYVFAHVPKETYADIHRIGISGNGRIYDTGKYQLKNVNAIRTVSTASTFFNGLALHYNYFEGLESLKGQTPAEAAKIDYSCHTWQELIEKTS